MPRVKNHLNQPLTVGERTLPAGGEITVSGEDHEHAKRLAARGHVSIIEDIAAAAAPPPPPPAKPADTNTKEPQK